MPIQKWQLLAPSGVLVLRKSSPQGKQGTFYGMMLPDISMKADPTVTQDDFKDAGLQRLFQKGACNYVLLHKSGKAIAFRLDRNGNVTIVDRLTDVSFRSTGLALIDEGWKCIGPGLEYSRFF